MPVRTARGGPAISFRNWGITLLVVAVLAGGMGYVSSDRESRKVSNSSQLTASSAPAPPMPKGPAPAGVPTEGPGDEQRIAELTAKVEALARELEQLRRSQSVPAAPAAPAPASEPVPAEENIPDLPDLVAELDLAEPPSVPVLPNISPPVEVPTSLPVVPSPPVVPDAPKHPKVVDEPADVATCTRGARQGPRPPAGLTNRPWDTFVGGEGASRQKSLEILRSLIDWRQEAVRAPRPVPVRGEAPWPQVDPEAAQAARRFICNELSQSLRELQRELRGTR